MLHVVTEKVQQLALFSKYDNDRQEQYSRRESIRISGLGGGDNEDGIIKKIIELGKEMEVEIKDADISAAHRIGRPGSGPRSVICRFVSRQTKDKVMKGRKKLKDLPDTKGKVYVNEDLTPLCSTLLSYAKSLDQVQRVNSANGRIHCNLTDGSHYILDSPDDLFKLGVTNIDLNRLGLSQYVF